MSTFEPTLFLLLMLGGLFLDLGVAVAAPRLYWNTWLPVFRRFLGQQHDLSFEDLSRMVKANPGWTIRWIATDQQVFRIGFRERLFGISSLYTPLMHGELVDSSYQLFLVSRLNWFPIGFSVVFVAMAIEFRAPDFLAALGLIVGILFFVQRYRFTKFGNRCLEAARRDGADA